MITLPLGGFELNAQEVSFLNLAVRSATRLTSPALVQSIPQYGPIESLRDISIKARDRVSSAG
jgi:hypothetical protein